VASLKEIRKRIGSVRSTQQVTKAMKMVAAAKLRRAQESAENARAYAEKLTGLLGNLAAAGESANHPLLRSGTDEPGHLILLTADRGLCGGYNANLVRLAETFLASDEGNDATMTVCGRRGNDHFRRRDAKIETKHINLVGGMDIELAREVAAEVTERFLAGKSGAVYVIYTRFKSAMSQDAVVSKLLPIATEASEGTTTIDYVYEPDAGSILGALAPRYVETRLYSAMLEATASEHGARMTAMDSASRNASDMIDRLTLEMNRARQASITTELMEIVGGAEALNG
jgi:F-type H+-transporting ATPase subunit gamma